MGRKLDDLLYKCSTIWDDCKPCLLCIVLLTGVLLFAVLLAGFGFIRHISITIPNATLTNFTLVTSPTTSLSYNLSLTLVIHNPNWAMGLKNTKPLDAIYKFDGQVFDRFELAGEGAKHPPGKTRVYHVDGGGGGATARPVVLGNAGEVAFRRMNRTGVFEVEVDVVGEVRYTLRYTKCKILASCPVKLQLERNGDGGVVFQRVKCKLAKAEKNC